MQKVPPTETPDTENWCVLRKDFSDVVYVLHPATLSQNGAIGLAKTFTDRGHHQYYWAEHRPDLENSQNGQIVSSFHVR